MKPLKPRHLHTKKKLENCKGFGIPFPVLSNRKKVVSDLFRVEFIHITSNGEELYYYPQWYQIRDLSSVERQKLLKGINMFLKDEETNVEQSLVFLAIALKLDRYRRQHYHHQNKLLPNTAIVYPAVKSKDEVIRYPIAHFIDKGLFYLGEKEDKLLSFAINKSVFTPDTLKLIN